MPSPPAIIVIGGGGHAQVLVDTIQLAHPSESIGVLDADATRIGQSVLDVPILGTDELLANFAREGARWFAVGLAGARDNSLRARLYDRAVALGLEPLTVIHPRSTVSRWATVNRGCQIFAGAVVNARAVLAEHVIVNTGSIVEHDCHVGAHAHVATGARLAGGVIVDELAHIGAGAIVRQLVRIGKAAVVGAGAAVVKDVLPATVVAGVPAKEITT